MISRELSNSVNVTAAALAAQHAADATYRRDFADGKRKFWQGLSLCYCANNAERAGFWAAADDSEVERRVAQDEIEHEIAMDNALAIRESMTGAW